MAKMHGNSVPTVQHCTQLTKERLCCSQSRQRCFGPIQQNHMRGKRIHLVFLTSITEPRSPLFYLQGHHSLRYKYSPVVLKILRQAFLLIALPSELNTVSNFKSARAFAKWKKRLSVSLTLPPPFFSHTLSGLTSALASTFESSHQSCSGQFRLLVFCCYCAVVWRL